MHFREKFNFSWDLIPLASENAAEKVRIWINSGDMPDVVVVNDYNHGEYTSYVEQGLVYRFPDGWKERWPNAAKAFQDTELGPALEGVHGGTYYFPRALFSTNKPAEKTTPHYLAYMRKDWMEAVGFEIKDTYKASEIMEFARLLKEKDPGAVGNRLIPISVKPEYLPYIFTLANSTFSGGALTAQEFFKDMDGLYKWGPAQPDTLVGLELYKQAYDEGLLHPEFYTYSGVADNEDFYIAGISGVTIMPGMASYMQICEEYFRENLNLEYADVVHTAAIVGEDGKYHAPELINYAGVIMFSPSISTEKFERYMDLMDYAATEIGQLITRMGFEGVDWKYDENGELVSLLPEGDTAREKYPSVYPVYHRLVIMSDDFTLINPSLKKEYRDRVVEMYQLKYELGKDGAVAPTDWDVTLFSSDARNRLSYDFGLEYATLVMGSGDVKTEWEKWVENNAYLIDPVLEEMNAQFGGQ